MVAVMGGVDGIVFTGGVGEHSSVVRSRAMNALAQFGVALDEGRNDRAQGDCLVSTTDSKVTVLVVESREDIEIARQVRAILS
jgi:acetate kinase